jgi:hypothetical protein
MTPALRAILLLGRRRSTSFASTVAALYSGGVPGAAFDFTDQTKLFQLSNGTTAVTADADPIGYATDLSGNGKHATQATVNNRPLYKVGTPRALFDGSNDILSTAAIDFTGTDKMTVVANIILLSDVTSVPIEISADANANNGAFCLFRSLGGAGDISPLARNTASGYRSKNGASAPYSAVLTLQYDLAAATVANMVRMRIDGVQATFDNTQGTSTPGAFGTHALNIGSRVAAFPSNCAIKRLVVIGRTLTDAELLSLGG